MPYSFRILKNALSLREMEEIYGKKLTFICKDSSSDAEAAQKLGLAPPNFYRMCKELGLKS